MSYRIWIVPYRLQFIKPAGTSRGVYQYRDIHFVIVANDKGDFAIGECAPLPQLSVDDVADYSYRLAQAADEFALSGTLDRGRWERFPSIVFGIESAMQMLYSFDNQSIFLQGKKDIPINGLVWMNDFETMMAELDVKLQAGFKCIKLKIGAIDFDKELSLIRSIRDKYTSQQIEIRVDANGAFSPKEAPYKLEQLAKYDIHSIEQPIAAKQYEALAQLCSTSPLPIALDEELIGVDDEKKADFLRELSPQYIVLKPSLHGGLSGCSRWIAEAQSLNIDYWITSALESNIGLLAIADYTSQLPTDKPQGLGTGMLYRNNIDIPLHIEKGMLLLDKNFSSQYKSHIRSLCQQLIGNS